MNYIAAVAAGLVYGAIAGYLKYFFLWKKILKDPKSTLSQGRLYTKMIISNIVNVIVLLIVFLLRNTIPVDFAWVLLATAVSLSLSGKLAPMKNIAEHVKEDAS